MARENVVVIMTDDQTAAALAGMPVVNNVLAAEGTRFDQAIELCRRGGFRDILLRGDTDFSQNGKTCCNLYGSTNTNSIPCGHY